jgi:hypothetical protein
VIGRQERGGLCPVHGRGGLTAPRPNHFGQ